MASCKIPWRSAHGIPVHIDDTTGLLTEASARNIAAEWHDGGKLLALASTGTVEQGVSKDIAKLIDWAESDNDIDNLVDLLAYCRAAGDVAEF